TSRTDDARQSTPSQRPQAASGRSARTSRPAAPHQTARLSPARRTTTSAASTPASLAYSSPSSASVSSANRVFLGSLEPFEPRDLKSASVRHQFRHVASQSYFRAFAPLAARQ